MFNIKNKKTGTLMLGASTSEASVALHWLDKYRVRYPNDEFELVENAPAWTLDVPEEELVRLLSN